MIRIPRVAPAILMLAVTTASAHVGMHGRGAPFDTDKDGGLSLAEFTAYLKSAKRDESNAAALFAAADLNKNGSVSGAEFTAALRKSTAANSAP